MDNNCLQCDKTLSGRIDKKFCDAYCRNSYNNQVKRKDQQYILSVNRQLRKNRRILKTLSPTGMATVRKDVLDAMGYQYNQFSHVYRAKNSGLYFFCYDYGFRAILKNEEKKVLIVNQQDYMKNYALDPWRYA